MLVAHIPVQTSQATNDCDQQEHKHHQDDTCYIEVFILRVVVLVIIAVAIGIVAVVFSNSNTKSMPVLAVRAQCKSLAIKVVVTPLRRSPVAKSATWELPQISIALATH